MNKALDNTISNYFDENLGISHVHRNDIKCPECTKTGVAHRCYQNSVYYYFEEHYYCSNGHYFIT